MRKHPKASWAPAFWQKDPAADFEDEGRMHCAPTAVSDGLIYLAESRGMQDLIYGSDTPPRSSSGKF